jgi:N-sulfoglucosamine sulfohydrolase
MTRRRLMAGMGACAGLLSGAGTRRPNILLITADDLGPMLSCYGETRIQTPNLDKLAASGTQFKVAYVTQASCSPSRSSIFTGMYPHGTGQYGLANTNFSLHPYLRSATIPALLKTAGYRTGIIGKLHVSPEKCFPFDRTNANSGDMRRVRDVPAKVEEFFEQSKGQPFFLMVNYTDPHAFSSSGGEPRSWFFRPQVDGLPEQPLQPSAETVWPFQQIDTPEQRERVANYYNAVLRLDHGIGLLMQSLNKYGLADNTLVIFLGDHGPPFDRGKTSCYESGLRVPFLVRWPGVSKPMKSDAMVSSVDILPTVLDAAGIEIPGHVHGKSLRPVVSDPRAKWREYLAGEFHCHGSRVFFPRRAIRDSRYKLIHNLRAGKARPIPGIDGDIGYEVSQQPGFKNELVREVFARHENPPQYELYDLQADPTEFHNLADKPEFARIQKRMTAAMERWRAETRDPFIDPAYTGMVANLTQEQRAGDAWRPKNAH